MKLIHCADLHLDSRMNTYLDKGKARERRAELLRTFQRMVAFGAQEQVEGILIAGDLFDTRNVSATAKRVVLETIEDHPEISFYYLKGNHDQNSFLDMAAGAWDAEDSEGDGLPPNLFLFGDTWTSYELGMSGTVVLSGMEINKDNSNVANSLVLDGSKINLVTLHGLEIEIQLKDLRNKGIDYLALGHIHAYKEGQLDARGVYCYPGCLEGRGFDECGPHGFVLLDIDEKTGFIQRTWINSGGREIYDVAVDVTGCQFTAQMTERMDQALQEAGCDSRSMVKVRLTGTLDVECEKDLTYIWKTLEGAFDIVKLEDETTLQVDPLEYLRDKTLKGEFVRRVMAREDLNPDEKARIIRYGLQAIAGEEIGS